MKNIGRVFWNDCKHIGRNVVALIVVMGLAVLPSMHGLIYYQTGIHMVQTQHLISK